MSFILQSMQITRHANKSSSSHPAAKNNFPLFCQQNDTVFVGMRCVGSTIAGCNSISLWDRV